MPNVEYTLEIPASAEQLFDLSQDPDKRLKWDPFPKSIELLDGATKPDVGVRVGGESQNGVSMEVVYVSFNRPRAVAMKMVRGPWYFERFAGSWLFDAIDSNTTKVTFRYSFRFRGKLLSWLLSGVVARRVRKDIEARLQGLKTGAAQLLTARPFDG